MRVMIHEARKTQRPTTVWIRAEWVAKIDDWRLRPVGD